MAPVVAYLRRDHVDEVPSVEETNRRTVFAGAGVELPVDTQDRPPMRLLVGWSRSITDAHIRSLPGAGAEARVTGLFVQLDFRARATLDGVDISPIPEPQVP
jgi:hypothetical protein